MAQQETYPQGEDASTSRPEETEETEETSAGQALPLQIGSDSQEVARLIEEIGATGAAEEQDGEQSAGA